MTKAGRKWPLRVLLALVGVFVVIQLMPYGRAHTNPATRVEPQWSSPEVRELAVRACFDCHSNQTRWPWYSHIAPVSWLVQRDTEEGREKLNFSEWNRTQEEADEAAKEVREGEMPPWFYAIPHPEARLSDAERTRLADGLAAMFGEARDGGEGGDSHDGRDRGLNRASGSVAPTMTEPASAHTHHAIDYIELTVTDLNAAKRFYGSAFGWTFADYGPDYAGIRGVAREQGGLRLGTEVARGGPLVVLFSNDLDASLAGVRTAGGRIVQEPFAFPGGRRFQFADPSGNELAVWSER